MGDRFLNDTGKTHVMRLSPGGRKLKQTDTPSAPPPPPPSPPSHQATVPEPSRSSSYGGAGFTPLTRGYVNAGRDLLELAGALVATQSVADLKILRAQAVDALRRFDREAATVSGDYKSHELASYLLCATLDDIVQNQSWRGKWNAESLAAEFHVNIVGGDSFYDQVIPEAKKQLAQNRPELLELVYHCLRLGFQGRYRKDGRQFEHDTICSEIYGLLRNFYAGGGTDLSPQWRPTLLQNSEPSRLTPIWLFPILGLGILIAGFFVFDWQTASKANPMTDEIKGIKFTLAKLNAKEPPAREIIPPPPPPPEPLCCQEFPTLRDKIGPNFQIIDEPNVTTLRMMGAGLFKSGSDEVDETGAKLFKGVGVALRTESGTVCVEGHTDSDRITPGSGSPFRNNQDLSNARAKRVRDILRAELGGSSAMIDVKGLSNSRPIVSPEQSPEDKAKNRRVEVVLDRRANARGCY